MVSFQTRDIEVIGEVANVHEGDVEYALDLVDVFGETADALKWQIFAAEEIGVASHPDYELYEQLAIDESGWERIIEACRDEDISTYADVFGQDSAKLADELGVDALKIHTTDVSNTPLLETVAGFEKPVILSVGGSTTVEIQRALATLEQSVDDLALMYGFQNFPTELADTNLARLRQLDADYEYPVGFASHIQGESPLSLEVPRWAVAAGASLLEIHIMLEREERTDHYSSLTPDRFQQLLDQFDAVTTALGTEDSTLTDAERSYRNAHKKTVVAAREIDAGEYLTRDSIAMKRVDSAPEGAIHDPETALGRRVSTSLQAAEPIRTRALETTVAATLACRSESTRLYGKPLQLVGDKPILQHQVERLQRVDAIDEIVLALADTPSKTAFIEFADEHGLEYVIGSEPDVLSRLIKAGNAVDADLAVRAMTENPYIYWRNIDKLIQTAIDTNADMTTTKYLPYGSFVEVIPIQALETSHSLGSDRHRSELCSLYITENSDSFDVRSLEPPEQVQRPYLRLTVDNPVDLMLMRRINDGLGGVDADTALERIVEYLDENPELLELNADKTNGTDPAVKETSWHLYGEPP